MKGFTRNSRYHLYKEVYGVKYYSKIRKEGLHVR